MAILVSISVFGSWIFTITNTTATQDTANMNKTGCMYTDFLVYDERGTPYYDYGHVGDNYIGLQRNPVTVTHEALNFYEEYESNPKNDSAKNFFINNADWLVNNPTTKQYNGSYFYVTYEYDFPLVVYNIEPPWRSGMAQGRALDVLAKAHELTGNSTYLDTAKKVLNSFFIEVKDGGITYKTNESGWWYELFATQNQDAAKKPRVLNGMIYSVLGLYEYYKYTNDSGAKYLFDQGVLALKNNLSQYDENGTASYDAVGNPANADYQSLHIMLLGQLYELTGEAIFKQYRDRWGEIFIQTQLSGQKLEREYKNTCGDTMFGIDIRRDNNSQMINLLDIEKYTWKAYNDAKVSQLDDELHIVVDTDSSEKGYNRAYLQTQLNFTQKKPLVLLLDYVAESFDGNATFAVEIKEEGNNNTFLSSPLNQEETNLVYLLPPNITNKSIELILYVITEDPGSSTLALDEAAIITPTALIGTLTNRDSPS